MQRLLEAHFAKVPKRRCRIEDGMMKLRVYQLKPVQTLANCIFAKGLSTAENHLVLRKSAIQQLGIGLILVLLLSGCWGSGPEPTPTPTKTPVGNAVAEAP